MKRKLLTIFSVLALGISGALYSTALFAPVPSAQSGGLTGVAAAQQTQNVTIQNFAFSPANITVAPGTTVTWTNKDPTAHTVTSDTGSTLNSSQLMNGQTYSHTFTQPGTYAYHCSIHPQIMKGSITVSSSTSPSQPQGGGTSGTQPQQQPMQMGGMGAGGTQTPTTPTPSGGGVAQGPVAAGNGSVAMNARHAQERIGAASVIALLSGGTLLAIRRRTLLSR